MKKHMNRIKPLLLPLMLVPALTFTACEKDDPVPEVPLETYDGLTIRFTEVEMHGDHHHAVEDPATTEVRFIYENGEVVIDGNEHIHLNAELTYLTEITIWDDGEEINGEFQPELHQFFFTGAPDEVLDYSYIDKDKDGKGVGFKGYLTVLKKTDVGFDFKVALIHFSGAGVKPAINWNDPDYANKIAGAGHHDFEGTFELHPVQSDHDHDH